MLKLQLDDLLIAHAIARATLDVRETALAEFCAAEACGDEHAIVAGARLTAGGLSRACPVPTPLAKLNLRAVKAPPRVTDCIFLF